LEKALEGMDTVTAFTDIAVVQTFLLVAGMIWPEDADDISYARKKRKLLG
jgi:hypothetical protein